MTTHKPGKHKSFAWKTQQAVNKVLLILKNKKLLFVISIVLLIAVVSVPIALANRDRANTLVPVTPQVIKTKPKVSPSVPAKTAAPSSTPATPAKSPVTPVIVLPTPAAPTGLTGNATSMTSVSLSWTTSSDPGGKIVAYELIRNGSIIAKPDDTSYTDQTAAPNTSYTYSVKAVDLDGYISPSSSTISVQTPPVFVISLGTGTVNPAPPTQSFLGDPIDFDFPVTANTAGTITYEIVDSYGIVMQPPTPFTFNAAGEQDITLSFVTPEDWVSENDNNLSATATLEVLSPLAANSNAVTFDWLNF